VTWIVDSIRPIRNVDFPLSGGWVCSEQIGRYPPPYHDHLFPKPAMSRAFPVSIPHGPARTYSSSADVLMDAAGHARNRLLHSCEAVSLIGGLALQHPGRTPSFTIEGAKVQDAKARSGEQAAHVLPGQILIDGKPPWSFAGGDRERVAWLARFMVTSAVPAPFNVADSAAEKAGLKEAFRQACERAWRAVGAGRQTLIHVFDLLLEDANLAFQKA